MPANVAETDNAATLLSRIARGDSGAIESFFDTYQARVYAFALKRVRNATDAAEILNDTMLEVWRSAARFEGRSQPLTWVLGIANHKTLDRLRKRHGQRDNEELDDDLPDNDQLSAVDALVGAEDALRVRRCLEPLSDAHRLVIHLAFFEDLPYPEIAEIVGCPVGTVKTRVFHAKQLLKRCLGSQSGP